MTVKGPVAEWFAPRMLPGHWSRIYATVPNYGYTEAIVPRLYDALVFVEKTTTTCALPGGRWLIAPLLASPTNLDFESGVPGEPPTSWDLQGTHRHSDYEVVTSTDRPYQGKQCSLIRRSPGRHYGEFYGVLRQRVDPTRDRAKGSGCARAVGNRSDGAG